ncbi:MAG: hypothetical protein KBF88_13700 [Polyangiaceae bacterium]|nr:hypothetical protein [Polyangiaceae bacterium]
MGLLVRTCFSTGVIAFAMTLDEQATAAPTKEQCAKAAEVGQQERDEGNLMSAKTSFITCASETCPAFIREDCGRWLESVESRMPTFIFRVKDKAGREIVGTSIRMDGRLVNTKEGRLQSADPGKHIFSFALEGYRSVELPVTVREGEKNRTIDLELTSTRESEGPTSSTLVPIEPPPHKGRGFPILPVVFSGIAVAGGTTFALLASSAKTDRDELLQTCAPVCDPSSTDPIATKLIIANTALGIGVAALGVAIVTFVLHYEKPTAVSSQGFAIRF